MTEASGLGDPGAAENASIVCLGCIDRYVGGVRVQKEFRHQTILRDNVCHIEP